LEISPGKQFEKPHLENTQNKRGVEHLPSKHEALSLNPSTAKREKQPLLCCLTHTHTHRLGTCLKALTSNSNTNQKRKKKKKKKKKERKKEKRKTLCTKAELVFFLLIKMVNF
jgi:hypothetical protein